MGHRVDFYCVARSHPKWWKGKCYESLAPSKHLLFLIKHDGLSWEEYKVMYLAEIMKDATATEKLLNAIWRHAQLKDLYLVCWEKTEQNVMDTECHTVILMDLIECLAREQAWYC